MTKKKYKKAKKPFILCNLPEKVHYAAGSCPYCNRLDTFLNNKPLTAYCGGTEANPHTEWEWLVPVPHNPHLPNYNPDANVRTIDYDDLRPEKLKLAHPLDYYPLITMQPTDTDYIGD